MTFTCRNTSMAQFAGKARELTGDYRLLQIADLTRLARGFDFAVTWTPTARTNAVGRGGNAAAAEAAAPSGQLNFFEALKKQLGLSLQQQKLPMPVMVIDHVQPPAEN